jgi:hypothetical protein
MKCPKCGTCESRVKKTIIQVEEMGFAFGELKQRRRKCLSCGEPFNTFEVHESVFRQLPPALQEQEEAVKPSIRRRRLDLRRSLDD